MAADACPASDARARLEAALARVPGAVRAAHVAEAVGEPPARIVSVWLIAVSIFQKREGRVEFADVWLESGDRRVQVL